MSSPLDTVSAPGTILVIITVMVLISGCSENENEGPEVFSAFSGAQDVHRVMDDMPGEHQLVVVTGMEPGKDGKAAFWKFAYNNVTSGIPLSSVKVTVDGDGRTELEFDAPLSKTPIRNWSMDSTSAYAVVLGSLIENGTISERTSIKVNFIYLLGDKLDNRGCEWTIGMILGSETPLEVTTRVDGNTGEIIGIAIS
ncbi:MAG: hypothetical protein JXA22_02205 [Candidatus Thermoplasmatota archaeon]|nr:hypothetical protein [Candidatus Thermoplasmatota archaeon]